MPVIQTLRDAAWRDRRPLRILAEEILVDGSVLLAFLKGHMLQEESFDDLCEVLGFDLVRRPDFDGDSENEPTGPGQSTHGESCT